jgi:NAD(P)-dependent dehydrogenase (short-subunit alcohol dehydrogenase family)
MWKDEVVVITGASAGVGRATVREFARHGASIGLLARGVEGLCAAQKEVQACGGRALVLETDVADPDQVEEAAAAVENQLGLIDIWVNNAMVSVFSPVKEMTPEDYQRVTHVTYLGVVYGTLSALKCMLPRNRGVIVQVGSALAYRSIPLQSAYCGAKHAVVGFTDSLRCELYHDHSNVKITMVQLPALNTPQFGWVKSRLRHKAQPVPPIFQPEVAARGIYWAAHHAPRELFIGASTVLAIEANKIVPGVIDRYLGMRGYQSQQMEAGEDPERPNNLWKPIRGEHGAHGSFDSRAHRRSYQLWAATHKELIAVLAGAVAGISFAALRAKQHSEVFHQLAA